jgi:hypothetical protein
MDYLSDAVLIRVKATRRKKQFNEIPHHQLLANQYAVLLMHLWFVIQNYYFSHFKAMQDNLHKRIYFGHFKEMRLTFGSFAYET